MPLEGVNAGLSSYALDLPQGFIFPVLTDTSHVCVLLLWVRDSNAVGRVFGELWLQSGGSDGILEASSPSQGFSIEFICKYNCPNPLPHSHRLQGHLSCHNLLTLVP